MTVPLVYCGWAAMLAATLSSTIRCIGISPESPSDGMSYFRTLSLQPQQMISMVAPSSCSVVTGGSVESKIMPLDRNTSSKGGIPVVGPQRGEPTVALLPSPSAPTTNVSPEIATDQPNESIVPEAMKRAASNCPKIKVKPGRIQSQAFKLVRFRGDLAEKLM